jgi:5'-AMP-activated protein kinase catalytic alpha subunit
MSVLEEYEILSVIGEGTFGVVKLGKIKKTGEEVAIKILEKKKIINEEDEERVDREIEILKKVHHINVIRIIKIEVDEENIYLIMEFCEKGELFNHIVEEQKLDEIESAYYYYQLINGLECLHYYGIVHRDLKPENLLLSRGYILKIIDFGLSNYFDKKELLSTPCGSPCYASPEMVSGKKYNGFLIDIWSTGIILYAMLCGYLPFEDPDNDILFQKISNCEPEFPEDLSEDAIDLMKRIMVNNPKHRITIPDIKKHPFYLKGKNHFESIHKNLVNKVEIDYSKIDRDGDKNIKNEGEKKYEINEDYFRKKEKKKGI